jgi:hypothetical protein
VFYEPPPLVSKLAALGWQTDVHEKRRDEGMGGEKSARALADCGDHTVLIPSASRAAWKTISSSVGTIRDYAFRRTRRSRSTTRASRAERQRR